MTWVSKPEQREKDDLYWIRVREGTVRVPHVAKGGIRDSRLYRALSALIRKPDIPKVGWWK